MAALSDPHNFVMSQENHVEQMTDMGIVQPDIEDIPASNEKTDEAKEADATKKGRKTRKYDEREDFLAALSDPRSYFATQVKRSQQKKGTATDESVIKNGHADGRLTGSTKVSQTAKKSSKTKSEAENREDFLAALSDPREYFAAQVKHAEQMKAMGIVEPDIQHAGEAGAVKKQSKSKKGAEHVCIII